MSGIPYLPDWLMVTLQLSGVIGGLIGAAGAVVMWAVGHTMLSQSDFDAYLKAHGLEHQTLDARLDAGSKHFAVMDADRRHQPGFTHIEELRREVFKIDAGLREIAATQRGVDNRLDGIENQVARLIDFHLKGKK